MEVLQCDGCDFRAPSYEDLKAHIQDVHTAFLQPTDVSEESPSQPRSGSMNASNQTEVEYSSVKDEFTISDEIAGKSQFWLISTLRSQLLPSVLPMVYSSVF